MPDFINTASRFEDHCYHCGDPVLSTIVSFDEKSFCCEGCKTVYVLLKDNDLCNYYSLNHASGISFRRKPQEKYEYLDDPDVIQKILDFSSESLQKVRFYLPQIHCSSCLWLLENLARLDSGIQLSRVHFLKKEVTIMYDPGDTTLRQVVELLSSLGYNPVINLDKLEKSTLPVVDKSIYYKLGLAGFVFGNIMLFSFPEYLGLDKSVDGNFSKFFGWINLVLILPVILYSGKDYLQSAFNGLKQKHLNIDVPVSLGILALFGRSAYEIITHTGAGYLDSLSGLLFFLLIGKWFQQRTFYKISFDRDYRSYFPIAATRVEAGKEESVSIDKLEKGDIILLRHGELIPADGVLIDGNATIDYSFVTGEAETVSRGSGDLLFAGGRQMGSAIKVKVKKKVASSYLTTLWNEDAFLKDEKKGETSEIADTVAKYFTITILIIAAATLLYWYPKNAAVAFNAFTAVLIVACPCAVALSIPFTFGNVLRLLAQAKFYLKNTAVIENISRANQLVFDKTGTLTNTRKTSLHFQGDSLTSDERLMVRSLVRQSSHPVSQAIYSFDADVEVLPVDIFEEVTGKGIKGSISGHELKLGSSELVFEKNNTSLNGGTYLSIDGKVKGYFKQQSSYRNHLSDVFDSLKSKYDLHILTGDGESEKQTLLEIIPVSTSIHYRQSPHDKLRYIKKFQELEKGVIMIGDGLNDAGALKQSKVGIVIADDVSNFTPASDAILQAEEFPLLPTFFSFMRKSVNLVYLSYALALVYNVIGLGYAVQGLLSPVIAAILMPLSSVTIVLFGIGSTTLLARRMGI